MRHIIIILIACMSSVLWGQEDSEEYLFAKINKANGMVNNNPNKASLLIQDALKESINSANDRATGYCYNTLGAINYKLNSYSLSVEYYRKSLSLFEDIGESSGKYNSLKYLGASYEASGNLIEAKSYYLIFLKLAQNALNISDQLTTYLNLGRVSYNNGNQEEALIYFDKAFNIEVSRNNEKGMAQIKVWQGMINEKLGNGEQAVQSYTEGSQMAVKNNDIETANMASTSLGNYYNQSQRNTEAIKVEENSLNYNKRNGNRSGQRDNVQQIAKFQLEEDNPKDAIPFIKLSMDISKELGDIEALTNANLLLSQAYEQQGEYDSALVEYKKYLNLVDSVENVKAEKELGALKMSKDLNSKVRELEKLRAELNSTTKNYSSRLSNLEKEKENERQERVEERQEEALKAQRSEAIQYSLLGLLLVVAVATALIYRSWRQKRRANQLLALKSLRSQMNPHFIFNSLNSVNSFIALNDERSANKYLSEFSRLMRAVMENSKHDFVPLSSELDILKMYLNLEHLRFKDKFDFTFTVDPSLDAEAVQVPPMLIQPYIENAIWHGLRYKDAKGHLAVEFKKVNNQIVTVIEDDGIGRKKSQALKTKNQKESVSTAMKNIEGRLSILNKLHKTNLDVMVMDLEESGEPRGTRVEVQIPYSINKEAA